MKKMAFFASGKMRMKRKKLRDITLLKLKLLYYRYAYTILCSSLNETQ